MTSAKATEFLTKQLSIEKETVTFRWLSRKLSIHVNVAKNELASFYASSRSTDAPVHATYLLIGDVAPLKAAGSYRDNGEAEIDEEDDAQDSVSTSKIVLVGEDELEAAKAQFTRRPSVHIYSLSPAAIRDAALLAPMADRVRPDDVSKGRAYNQTIGIVVGSDVKIGQGSKPGPSKPLKTITSAATSKLNPPTVAKKIAEKPRSSEKGKAPEKNRQDKKAGALDLSKAKSKGEKESGSATTKSPNEVVKTESKSGPKVKGEQVKPDDSKLKKQSMEAKMNTKDTVEFEKPKRGTKRPSAVMSLSHSEDDNPSPKSKPRISTSPLPSRPSSRANGVKVKKGVLLSDDEEENLQKGMDKMAVKQKGKARVSVAQEEEEEEEADPSTKAMMGLDDSEVIRHNTRAPASDHEEDVGMLSDDERIPTRPKAKRKPKKVVPVGRNGLPKKRVIKSKKSKNAKGYTVTEDYSSYESASESDPVTATSDTAKKPKKSRQKHIKEGEAVTTKPKGGIKPDDNSDNHDAKIAGKSHTKEGKLESKKPMSGSGDEGPTSKPRGKASNGGKNLMSYFTKK